MIEDPEDVGSWRDGGAKAEAALPPGDEPLLVPEDGELRTAELVEDELILGENHP